MFPLSRGGNVAEGTRLALLSWALRIWAMGYRNWVRGDGSRHLMTRGPYAFVRHPRYVANFAAGLAWLGLVADPVLLAVYSLLYFAVLGAVIVREEEKLARDYPGFGEWRQRVPAVLPALWRRPWRAAGARDPAERFQLATVTRGLEPLKLLGFLAALAALAFARRSGRAFLLAGTWAPW
ncbi:isoprenylcysteine carboxylmethyltransferase family protein [bacterium]|nr:isoprenylcysteine carboxylmethyltransferase family protein [bacterium]